MADRLAAVFAHFSVTAHTFHLGDLCGINALDAREATGQLHVVHRGELEVRHGERLALHITQPSVLLYPRPLPRRFITDPVLGANMSCADLRFEGGAGHPVVDALPDLVCLPLVQLPDADSLLALMFQEAQAQNCGRQAMLDRLFEVLLIQILRELMNQGRLESGMLAGLSHARLRRVLIALHEEPQRDWSLNELARIAGMSRTVFANDFHNVVGCPPATYLQRWRIGLAQKQLLQGRPLKRIVDEIGYGSESALSRAFKRHHGMSPVRWLKRVRAQTGWEARDTPTWAANVP